MSPGNLPLWKSDLTEKSAFRLKQYPLATVGDILWSTRGDSGKHRLLSVCMVELSHSLTRRGIVNVGHCTCVCLNA